MPGLTAWLTWHNSDPILSEIHFYVGLKRRLWVMRAPCTHPLPTHTSVAQSSVPKLPWLPLAMTKHWAAPPSCFHSTAGARSVRSAASQHTPKPTGAYDRLSGGRFPRRKQSLEVPCPARGCGQPTALEYVKNEQVFSRLPVQNKWTR